MKQDISDKIIQYGKELRLPVLRRDYQTEAKEAAKDGISYEEYLLRLMEKQFIERLENRKKTHIRIAGFPQKLYLHTLKKEFLPQNAQEKLPQLERLDFIEEGRNVILAGNPGTGYVKQMIM